MKKTLSILTVALVFFSSALFADKSIDALNNSKKFKQTETQLDSGKLSWISTKSDADITILFIHGNSACKEAFVQQLTDDRLNAYRLIAIDLPGHGASEDAVKPEETYSFRGYAKTLIDFCEAEKLDQVIICGWSLGGHIAMEMTAQKPDLVAGMFITGAPPISLNMDGVQAGFKPFEEAKMMGQEATFTAEEAKIFVSAGGIQPDDAPFMITAAERTDGLSRKLMIEGLIDGSGGVDEHKFIQETECPIAFAHGETDGGINGEYIQSLTYKNFRGFHVVKSGHAAHWEAADVFNGHLVDFCKSILS